MPLSYVQVCSSVEAFNQHNIVNGFQQAASHSFLTQLNHFLRYPGYFSSVFTQDEASYLAVQAYISNLTLLVGMFSSLNQPALPDLSMQLVSCGSIDDARLTISTLDPTPPEHPPSV